MMLKKYLSKSLDTTGKNGKRINCKTIVLINIDANIADDLRDVVRRVHRCLREPE
jgi:hypothetical protein